MLFNEILMNRRKELRLTQDELAEKLDISRQSVSKWENGECMPDTDKLIRLADVLCMSLDELTGRGECADPFPTDAPVTQSKSKAWLPRVLTAVACVAVGVACFFAGRASALKNNSGPVFVQGFGLLAEFDENDEISSIEQYAPVETTYLEEIVSIDREPIVAQICKYLLENENDLNEDEAWSIAEEIVDRFEKIEAEHANGNEDVLSYYSTSGGAQVFNMGKLIEEVLNEKRQ